MVIAQLHRVTREWGPEHKISFEVRYYVEEYCGRDGCTDTCMGFDTTGGTIIEFTLEQMKDRELFHRTAKDALRAFVTARHPFKHEIRDEDIVLCPTSF